MLRPLVMIKTSKLLIFRVDILSLTSKDRTRYTNFQKMQQRRGKHFFPSQTDQELIKCNVAVCSTEQFPVNLNIFLYWFSDDCKHPAWPGPGPSS